MWLGRALGGAAKYLGKAHTAARYIGKALPTNASGAMQARQFAHSPVVQQLADNVKAGGVLRAIDRAGAVVGQAAAIAPGVAHTVGQAHQALAPAKRSIAELYATAHGR